MDISLMIQFELIHMSKNQSYCQKGVCSVAGIDIVFVLDRILTVHITKRSTFGLNDWKNCIGRFVVVPNRRSGGTQLVEGGGVRAKTLNLPHPIRAAYKMDVDTDMKREEEERHKDRRSDRDRRDKDRDPRRDRSPRRRSDTYDDDRRGDVSCFLNLPLCILGLKHTISLYL
ncbi:hypothetical protein CPB86DRAFT_99988 [Serendipita vermifera]|nr:hypothetical protein CPB86DRAFT_99988 [Serendipita vermifera]